MKIENIRNFCIIAHIDHGKSTLADRMLEATNTITSEDMKSQVLDDMDLERERGITIKSHPIQMEYRHTDNVDYILNLIDTPGHVDFTYEVSRSLAACEGALLLVDAAQGVEAQTVSNAYLALDADLEIIPVINKIDMPAADLESSVSQICELLGCSKDEVLLISAKNNINIQSVFDAIIKAIPCPKLSTIKETRALIFDSTFDQFRGVVPYVRVFDGSLKKGMTARYFANSSLGHEIAEVGILKMTKSPVEQLNAGDVGYIITNVKDVRQIKVGDTLTVKESKASHALPGYRPIKPMVFAGLYPVDTNDYENLRLSLQKLVLNDSALSFEPNTSIALGFGFRCGFLGPLHMEIVQERLEREGGVEVVQTAPTVTYQIKTTTGDLIEIHNPADLPDPSQIDQIREPIVKIEIICPDDNIGDLMSLCDGRRGLFQSQKYISEGRQMLIFEIPLAEIIYDFYDKLKSITRGYGTMDYEIIEYRAERLAKVSILVNGMPVEALSMICHRDNAEKRTRGMLLKLRKQIDRHQFEIALQAAIGGKIIARETVKSLRKNVTAKCYGGDVSRKRKLLEKQKRGKKRMKSVGSVLIPQEAFLSILDTSE